MARLNMVQINVTHELPELVNHLQQLEQKLDGDLTPLMESIGSLLENSTRQRFEDKQSPNGISWASLMPSTLKKKRNKNSKDSAILVESGQLSDSFSFDANHQRVIVGTDKFYGKFHQFGTKKMVARSFLGLSQDDKDGINELIASFLGN